MKKKDYLKPTVNIVKLQQQQHLLQTSGETSGQAGVKDYKWNEEVTE